MGMVYFFWGILKARLFSVSMLGKWDFTWQKRGTDPYQTWKGKLKSRLGHVEFMYLTIQGLNWKQIWSSAERGWRSWNSDSWMIGNICSNVGPESKWWPTSRRSEPSEDRRYLRSHSKPHSHLSRGKGIRGGGEEATFREVAGLAGKRLAEEAKAKNNEEEKCFSKVRGEGWRLELLPCCFPKRLWAPRTRKGALPSLSYSQNLPNSMPGAENPPYSCLTQWKNEKIKVQDAPEELTPCVGWGLQVTLPLNIWEEGVVWAFSLHHCRCAIILRVL